MATKRRERTNGNISTLLGPRMVDAEDLVMGNKRCFSECQRLLCFVGYQQQVRKNATGAVCMGMIAAKFLLANCQRAFYCLACLCNVALIRMQHSEAFQTFSDIGMLGAQRALSNGEHLLKHLHRFCQFALLV